MNKVVLFLLILLFITSSISDASLTSLFGVIAKEALKAAATEVGKTAVEEFKKLFNNNKEIAKKGNPQLKEGKLEKDKRMWTISRGNLSSNDLKELAKILKSIDNDTDQVIKVNGSNNVVSTTQSGNVNFGTYQEILGENSVISQGQMGGITAQNVTIIKNESEKAPSKDEVKSEAKLPPTTAELEQNLREQIQFLRRSTEYFDKGTEDEAKRIASSLYILFVNASDFASLLEQMRIRDELILPDTAPGDFKGNLAPYMGLVGIRAVSSANNSYIGYIAKCLAYDDNPRFRKVPFAKWWKTVILDDHKGVVFTREALIVAVAEQDGGIRVASGLDPSYVELARKNGMGWKKGDTGKPMLGVELHSLREIAWEALYAISRQYPQYLP